MFKAKLLLCWWLVLAAALRESEDGEKITPRYACKSTDVSHRGDVVQCHESAARAP